MTLRSAYFADWKGKPTVLLWGDAIGMRELADFLRSERTFATFCEAVDGREIIVKMVCDKRDSGMHFAGVGLEWLLRSVEAQDFADKVDVLASSAS